MAAPPAAALPVAAAAAAADDGRCLKAGCVNERNEWTLFCSQACGLAFREANPDVCQQCCRHPVHVDAVTKRNLHRTPVCSRFCDILFKYRIPSGVTEATLAQYREEGATPSLVQTVMEEVAACANDPCLNPECGGKPASRWSHWCSMGCRRSYLAANPTKCKQCGTGTRMSGDTVMVCSKPDCAVFFEQYCPSRVTFETFEEYMRFNTLQTASAEEVKRRRGVPLVHRAEKCPICIAPLSIADSREVIILPCCRDGKFHKACLDAARGKPRSTPPTLPCPLCRADIATKPDEAGSWQYLPASKVEIRGLDFI